MTNPSDLIWAYLHNELNPEQKAQFEQALQRDPELREQLERCRSVHGQLAELLPTLNRKETPDEQLVEELITEWEAANPQYTTRPKLTLPRKILSLALPLAAAAMLILFALPASGPIHWQRTAYGCAPQLRGESATQPCYSRAELEQISRDLQSAVESACPQPDKWTLKINFQELADGAISVEVTGRLRMSSLSQNETGRNVISWSHHFARLQDLRHNIPEVGQQIANEL